MVCLATCTSPACRRGTKFDQMALAILTLLWPTSPSNLQVRRIWTDEEAPTNRLHGGPASTSPPQTSLGNLTSVGHRGIWPTDGWTNLGNSQNNCPNLPNHPQPTLHARKVPECHRQQRHEAPVCEYIMLEGNLDVIGPGPKAVFAKLSPQTALSKRSYGLKMLDGLGKLTIMDHHGPHMTSYASICEHPNRSRAWNPRGPCQRLANSSNSS